MNVKELLKDLQLPSSKENQIHATTLLNIYKFLNEIIPVSINVNETVLKFGRVTRTEFKHSGEKYERVINEGTELKAQQITIYTEIGKYVVTVPYGEILNLFQNKLGIATQYEIIPPEIIKTINIKSDIAQHIKKASKMVGKDELRPVFHHILIEIGNGLLRVVGTDAHRMYYSNKIECDYEQTRQFVIIGDFNKVKTASEIHILAGGNLLIDNIEFSVNTELTYPNYSAVIPEYETNVTFDKKGFIQLVKQALPTANKVSHLIKVSLNGNIKVSTEDKDWDEETLVEMDYKSKSVIDCEIGFDGKRLQSCLSLIDNKEIKMKTAGVPSRAVILEDINSNVLLMPNILNN